MEERVVAAQTTRRRRIDAEAKDDQNGEPRQAHAINKLNSKVTFEVRLMPIEHEGAVGI